MPVYDRAALDAPHERREMGMSDDLLDRAKAVMKRLRAIQISTGVRANLPILGERPIDMANKSVQDAADLIEALTAEVARLTAELADGSFYKESDIDALTARAEADNARVEKLRRYLKIARDEALEHFDRAEAAGAKLAQGVRVKPLVWQTGIVDWSQPLPGMKYVSCSTTPSPAWAWWLEGTQSREVHQNEAAAKAAAQSDYEARILAAIDAVPAAQIADDALEQAVLKLHWAWDTCGTKGERRVVAECVSIIRAMKGTMK